MQKVSSKQWRQHTSISLSLYLCILSSTNDPLSPISPTQTGQVDKTIDQGFADEEEKYRILEKESQALMKEAKNYLDAIRSLAASQARISDTIDGFYNDSSEAAMAANSYKRAVEELDNKTARELDAPYRATVLEPVGKLCSYFPEINKTIEKRNKKVSKREGREEDWSRFKRDNQIDGIETRIEEGLFCFFFWEE